MIWILLSVTKQLSRFKSTLGLMLICCLCTCIYIPTLNKIYLLTYLPKFIKYFALNIKNSTNLTTSEVHVYCIHIEIPEYFGQYLRQLLTFKIFCEKITQCTRLYNFLVLNTRVPFFLVPTRLSNLKHVTMLKLFTVLP